VTNRRSVQVGPFTDSASPGRRAVRASLLATGLLFVVAFGSRAALSPEVPQRAGVTLPAHLAQYLALLAAPVALALIIALVFVLIPQGRSAEGEDEGRVSTFARMPPWMRPLAIAALVAMMSVPVALAIWASGKSTDQSLPEPSGSRGAVSPGSARSSRTSAASFQWSLIPVAIVTTAGLGLVAFAVVRRRPPVTAGETLSSATRVRRSLIDSIAALRAEADPRRAVIAAYARMEHDLSILGISRRVSETASEYLDRLLTRLEVSPSSAVRLTALFERAKFGHRSVDDSMKS
jgi:hypothetical protein